MDTEAIRNSFRPNHIRLLMVGESPPAGGKFFYVQSQMTGFTARSFEAVHGRKFPGKAQTAFLDYFKQCGCYLDDVCHTPIDNLKDDEREQALAECVTAFGVRLREYCPDSIAVVLKKIEPHVRIAAVQSGVQCPLYFLPFSGRGHQNKYIKRLGEIIDLHVPSEPWLGA